MKNAIVATLALIAVGCGAPTANPNRNLVRRNVSHIDTATAREDRGRCDATQAGRNASEYDTNGDGVPDVRKVYQMIGEGAEVRSILVCREVDLNHDGTKDMFRFYNEEGRTLREEEDRDFDGRIDVISFFENGEVVRREMDTNGDGQVDMRVFYRDHNPYRAEREMNADHDPEFHPDYWEFYDSHGHVTRMGWDYDRDGRADRWDRVDRLAPMRAAQAVPQPTASGAPGVSGAPGASGAPASGAPAMPPTASAAPR
jgi:hypothetical protein